MPRVRYVSVGQVQVATSISDIRVYGAADESQLGHLDELPNDIAALLVRAGYAEPVKQAARKKTARS